MNCIVENCENKRFGQGLCSKHYTRMRRHGDVNIVTRTVGLSDEEKLRFHGWHEEIRTLETPCWIWNGKNRNSGYGVIATSVARQEKAHRASYRVFVGPIEHGKMILHACDQRDCLNPKHLRQGTHGENMQDMWDRGQHIEPKSQFTKQLAHAVKKRYAETGNYSQVRREFNISNHSVHNLVKDRIKNLRNEEEF